MSYYRRGISASFGGPLTPAVKNLIIANAVVFLLQMLVRPLTMWLALYPPAVLPWGFQIWRLVTYMFVHGGVSHLLFNMLALFIFGCSIERTWGTRSFYRYYFLCGLGGAIFSFLPWFFDARTIGASGAVYGILAAYAVLFPYNKILVLLTFPVEARYLVLTYGFIAFALSVSGAEGVAHIVHLGGLLTGYVLLRWAGLASGRGTLGRGEFMGTVRNAYRRWRMKRLRKKFEAYYEKRADRDEPPAIH